MLCCLPGPGSVQIADDSRTGYQDPGNPFGEPDPPLADQGKRCEEHSGSDTPYNLQNTADICKRCISGAVQDTAENIKKPPCDKKPASQCKGKSAGLYHRGVVDEQGHKCTAKQVHKNDHTQ